MIARYVAIVGRLRWPGLAAWLVVLAVAAALAGPLPDKLSGGGWYVAGSQSERVAQAQRAGFLGRGATSVTLVIRDERYTAADKQFGVRVREVLTAIERDGRLAVTSHYGWSAFAGTRENPFLGEDRRTATEAVGLDLDDGTARRTLPAIQRDLYERFRVQGLHVALIGTAPFWGEINVLSQEGLARAELLVLPLILVILLLIFRSVVSALVAMAVGVTAALTTFAVLSVLTSTVELSVFVQNTATMLGLGVGVDYSMFMIRRFRDEMEAGRRTDAALATTLRTSGHTVVASGATVILAMSTLGLVHLQVIQSIALGAALVVAMSVLTSLLVLPLLLRLLGPRIANGQLLRIRTGRRRAARWWLYTRVVLRRPVLFVLPAIAVLALAAFPATRLDTFTPDARIAPPSSHLRQGYDQVQSQFDVGVTSPLVVLVSSDTPLDARDDAHAVVALAERLSRLDHVARLDSALAVLTRASPGRPFAALTPAVLGRLPGPAQATVRHFVSADGKRLILDVVPEGQASDTDTRQLLVDVRAAAADLAAAGLTAAVGGQTAEGVDSNDVIVRSLPAVVGLMLLVIYLLLMVSFRSVLLPLKAIAVNVLSVTTTYGVLVLAFQRESWFSRLLGFEPSGHLTNFVPVLLLALLFSLSTDYEVFVLARVREFHRQGRGNSDSVALGVAATGPLISGAAVLMVAVFGAFSFTSILPIQELGFGMAVAIALDASIIRAVIVPATMRLMGGLNWWFPGQRRQRDRPLPAPGPPRHRADQRVMEFVS